MITALLLALEEAYNEKSWHGSNLKGSLRRVGPVEAMARLQEGRHNICEIVVHAAYWKYVVRRRITGVKRGSFPLKGSDWFPRPESWTAAAWREDIALLDEEHRKLRDTVEGLSEKDLGRNSGKFTFAGLIRGVTAHDLYHAGQIQLLKRMLRSKYSFDPSNHAHNL
jgi:hypothetical protein